VWQMAENKRQIRVKVETRPETIFDGTAYSMSSVNNVGKFDVLPRHANFISIVQEKLIIRNRDGSAREIQIKQGILKASKDEVSVYLD
jgi:F0F1-type ATP synthase epsilon subunit